MAVAEEQQKAVNAAIEVLIKEHLVLAQMTSNVEKATERAIEQSVRQSIGKVKEETENALGEAFIPLIERLSSVVHSASDAERSLKRASAWFAWKWVAILTGGVVGLCLVVYGVFALKTAKVESLRSEKARLQVEISQLQVNVDRLAAKGGRIELSSCGGRLCVIAANDQGELGKPKPWNDAAWQNRENALQFVIPRGY